MKGKILVTSRSFRKTRGPHWQILEANGYQIVESPYDHAVEADVLAPLVQDTVGVILGLDKMTADVINQARQLKVISRYGVGLDNVDLEAATARGIIVTNTPGANSISVAELALALILALARHILYHDQMVKQGGWTPVTGVELEGQTLGLIGLGRIGREVARRAAAFNMRLLYYDPVPPPPELLSKVAAAYRLLETLLSESDIISLHLPLTDDTRNLIDQQALARIKPSAFLINTSRGGLVDEEALYRALVEGKLAGAACDVFSHEPPAGNPLLTLDNFIATPHVGSTTRQAALRMGLMAAENALAVLRGERPANVVNPEVYAR